MKKTTILPLALTALLLAGCTGVPITREEAITNVTDIEEKHVSNDFSFPTKFTMTQKVKNDTLLSSLLEIEAIVTIDYEGKYYYAAAKASLEEENQDTKMWIYYQANDNTTYLVTDDGEVKQHYEFVGDLFSGGIAEYGAPESVQELYGAYDISAMLDYGATGDERNEYRSNGQGSLYFKVFVTAEGENSYAEVNISSYLILLVKRYIDDNNYSELSFKYSGISTAKPNLSNYPLFRP
ncbi:MAG: hypothetical protein EOM77_04910 [Bacteroidia bacterium]|nr:hypothetical protein [Bacteroidia bacterium]